MSDFALRTADEAEGALINWEGESARTPVIAALGSEAVSLDE